MSNGRLPIFPINPSRRPSGKYATSARWNACASVSEKTAASWTSRYRCSPTASPPIDEFLVLSFHFLVFGSFSRAVGLRRSDANGREQPNTVERNESAYIYPPPRLLPNPTSPSTYQLTTYHSL